MTSTRKQRKEQARRDAETRQWATDTAKALVLTLCQDGDVAVAPYNVGVVLDPGEKPWVQIPARCSLDPLRDPVASAQAGEGEPPVTSWLVTNHRIVGRYSNGDLRGWRWEWAVGCLTDLTAGHEYVHLDCREKSHPPRIDWYGPGVAPLAVAAVYHLHGLQALLEHPGLAPLRIGRTLQGRRDRSASQRVIRPPLVLMADGQDPCASWDPSHFATDGDSDQVAPPASTNLSRVQIGTWGKVARARSGGLQVTWQLGIKLATADKSG